MGTERYYDADGAVHKVHSEYSFGQYNVYVDGRLYACADDRIELVDTLRECVAAHGFTKSRPKKKRDVLLGVCDVLRGDA